MKAETQDIHSVQDLQSLDQVQKIGLIHIVDGQSSQSGSGNHMIHSALGISDKAGYTRHGTPPGDSCLMVMELLAWGGAKVKKVSVPYLLSPSVP